MLTVSEVPEFRNKNHSAVITPDATIRDACKLMWKKDMRAVVVVEDDKVVGIFAEYDLLQLMAKDNFDINTSIKDVMTKNPVTFQEFESHNKALDLMIHGHFRHIPIVDIEGNFVGILGLRSYLQMNLAGLISRIRRHKFLEFYKSPSFYAMLFGILFYTIIIIALISYY